MAEEQVIDKRHQRRALTAGSDIARAKIGDHRNTCALREDGGLADLQGIGTAFVEDGLAVAADELHRSVTLDRCQYGTRVEFAKLKIQARDIRGVSGPVGDAENGGANLGRVRCRCEADGLQSEVRPAQPLPHGRGSDSAFASADFHDGDIDAVERGAAHDAGDSHDRFNSFCNSLSSCSASMGRSSSRLRPRMRSAMP